MQGAIGQTFDPIGAASLERSVGAQIHRWRLERAADLRLAAVAEPLGLDGGHAFIFARAEDLRRRWRPDLPLPK